MKTIIVSDTFDVENEDFQVCIWIAIEEYV